MPRDLSELANEGTLGGMAQLSKAPNDHMDRTPALGTEADNNDDDSDEYEDIDDDDEFTHAELIEQQSNQKRDELHPYVQTLSLSDIESCIRLEDATFPPQERCTREKFQYRLKLCSELSLGIFTSLKNPKDAATASTSTHVDSDAPERKAVLLGHIIATKTTNETVTDNDMAIPTAGTPDPMLGHKAEGRTICIHSLAVLPEYQNRSLGSTLMKAYLHRMETQDVGDRVALIAHDHLIPYYEKLGFINQGPSEAQFGGGGWYDMVAELDPEDAE